MPHSPDTRPARCRPAPPTAGPSRAVALDPGPAGHTFRPAPTRGRGAAAAVAARPAAGLRGLRSPDGDRGQVALEYIGFIPILLFVALCAIQLGWVAYVHEQADTAARTAARAEARKRGSGEAAGRAAVRAGLEADVKVDPGRDAVTATVRIRIKSIVPGLGLDDATRTAIMPNDDPEVGP
ncbi:TadE/TadG family type IV pilus assembly protein [Streptomyces sp. NPDC032472]|uniref:TadE/TadG family type IV pilus assembly protein n=1 Tax=Streptomyces sp. NPDC032472 TaxID=3155018 RepID=UPI0033E37304